LPISNRSDSPFEIGLKHPISNVNNMLAAEQKQTKSGAVGDFTREDATLK
jgi:hypothetical protein